MNENPGVIDLLNAWDCSQREKVSIPCDAFFQIIEGMSPIAIALRGLAVWTPANSAANLLSYDEQLLPFVSANRVRTVGTVAQQMAIKKQHQMFLETLERDQEASYVMVYDYRLYRGIQPDIYVATFNVHNSSDLDVTLYGLRSKSHACLLYTLYEYYIALKYYAQLLHLQPDTVHLILSHEWESGAMQQMIPGTDIIELESWATDFDGVTFDDIVEIGTYENICRTHKPVIPPEHRRMVPSSMSKLCINIFQFWKDQR